MLDNRIVFLMSSSMKIKCYICIFHHTKNCPNLEVTSSWTSDNKIEIIYIQPLVMLSLFLCLFFFGGGSSHSRIFRWYGDVNVKGSEGPQILTFARHLHVWPLSSKGSLECHTYCDTGHPFIMVISEDPWHSHILTCCHCLF